MSRPNVSTKYFFGIARYDLKSNDLPVYSQLEKADQSRLQKFMSDDGSIRVVFSPNSILEIQYLKRANSWKYL